MIVQFEANGFTITIKVTSNPFKKKQKKKKKESKKSTLVTSNGKTTLVFNKFNFLWIKFEKFSFFQKIKFNVPCFR